MALLSQPVQREPVFRQVYAAIERQIVSDELAIGDTLHAETEIARLFSVNRSPVREAIRLLEENGLAERREGGKRLYVTSPKRSLMTTRMINTFVMNEITAQDIYEVVRMLQAEIATMAAERVTQEQLLALEENIAKTEANLHDDTMNETLDSEFHELLIKATGNRAMHWVGLGFFELNCPMAHQIFKHGGETVKTRNLQAHRHILAALRNHDATRAREWAVKHADDFMRGYKAAGLDMHAPVEPVKITL